MCACACARLVVVVCSAALLVHLCSVYATATVCEFWMCEWIAVSQLHESELQCSRRCSKRSSVQRYIQQFVLFGVCVRVGVHFEAAAAAADAVQAKNYFWFWIIKWSCIRVTVIKSLWELAVSICVCVCVCALHGRIFGLYKRKKVSKN